MKLRVMMMLMILVMLIAMLAGCAQTEGAGEAAAAVPAETEPVVIRGEVPVATVGRDDYYDAKIYSIDPDAPVVEIPEESVPLASTHAPAAGEITNRDAEAIAIHQAGLENKDVSFLYSKYVDEDVEVPYFQVEFRSNGIPYEFRIDAATGEILSYEKGN